MIVNITCPECGYVSNLEMTIDEWINYVDKKMLVQNVFPKKSLSYRETLISGMCARCQRDFFGDTEDTAA